MFAYLSKKYQCPSKEIEYAELVNYIDKFPDDDDPSIFGMSFYAENMIRENQATNLISLILIMEPLYSRSSRIE